MHFPFLFVCRVRYQIAGHNFSRFRKYIIFNYPLALYILSSSSYVQFPFIILVILIYYMTFGFDVGSGHFSRPSLNFVRHFEFKMAVMISCFV
jgi:hypothetical protein